MNLEKKGLDKIYFYKRSNLVAGLLYVLTIIFMGVLSYCNNHDWNSILKIEMLGIAEVTIILFYLKIEKKEYTIDKYYALLIGYIVSLLILALFNNYELYNLIIIGPVLIALIVDVNIGILINVYIVLTTSLLWEVNLENSIYYLVFVTLACIISKHLKNNRLIISIFMIMLSTHVALSLILNSFKYDDNFTINLIISSISTIMALVVIYSLYYVYNKFITIKEKITEEKVIEEKVIEEKQTIEEVKVLEITKPEKDEDYLLNKLKELSIDLYEHSNQVSDMCYRAAKRIGADADIVKIAGLYHEIGRINGKDYINEGVILANEHNFQKEVVDIIRQYSGLYEMPKTREAAIVLLTDSVISTMDYVKSRTDKKAASPEKIIEHVFISRIKKNLFDESGMELDDFKMLRSFYVEEYSKGEI